MTVSPPPCPRCGGPMRLAAHLPPQGELPAVSGYWCDACKIEQTIEEDGGLATSTA
jgi:hypothetical protein